MFTKPLLFLTFDVWRLNSVRTKTDIHNAERVGDEFLRTPKYWPVLDKVVLHTAANAKNKGLPRARLRGFKHLYAQMPEAFERVAAVRVEKHVRRFERAGAHPFKFVLIQTDPVLQVFKLYSKWISQSLQRELPPQCRMSRIESANSDGFRKVGAFRFGLTEVSPGLVVSVPRFSDCVDVFSEHSNPLHPRLGNCTAACYFGSASPLPVVAEVNRFHNILRVCSPFPKRARLTVAMARKHRKGTSRQIEFFTLMMERRHSRIRCKVPTASG